ncbi:MAG: glycine cleavage system aminomethyltransferase GcvT [Clostridiales bacterium]|nr:glycine cleavage system aminomethyltransferase GcvT [Clostridiales bacterium]
MEQSIKYTPLYEKHVALGGRMVPFAGYMLPIQYAGVIEEHMAVRRAAGIFDVSHMGELFLEGPDAGVNLQYLLTNDFSAMRDGRVRYSPLCNEGGGIVDDLLVYKLSDTKFMLVVNAANREKDFAFMQGHLFGDAILRDASEDFAQIAVQGPLSRGILEAVADALPEKYYTFIDGVRIAGAQCLVSRTGYTGELGYEIYCPAASAAAIWDALFAAGAGMIPCGLGARDTLRLEAGMPLYGHEMDDSISPLETGLDFAVKLGKADFIGKAAMIARGEPKIVRVGLRITGRGIARENCPVLAEGRQIGRVSSGTHLPYLGAAYAMAMLEREYAALGTVLAVDVRGRMLDCEVVELPFYKAGK